MTLTDCTRSELVWIVERLAQSSPMLQVALSEVRQRRVEDLLHKADIQAQIAAEARQRACDLLYQYRGQPTVSIPEQVLEEATSAMADADRADKKWAELMKRADKL